MNIKFLNPFLEAAAEVLQAEVNLNPTRGSLSLQKSSLSTTDITVLISIIGQVQGVVLYGMSSRTAMAFVSRIMGQEFTEFDGLAQSGIGELGNVISGRAAVKLSAAGYELTISTPTLIIGQGAQISTLDFSRIVVPLDTLAGQMVVHLAVREAGEPGDEMNVNFLNPFIDAATEVIELETGIKLTRGTLELEKTLYHTNDITVVIAMVGAVVGNVLYSLSFPTAVTLVSRMLGEKLGTFDALAQSGVAELGNVITGRASVKLADAGYESTISPPTLVLGKDLMISTLDRPRLVVPFSSDAGSFVIHLALREGTSRDISAAHLPVPQRPDIQ